MAYFGASEIKMPAQAIACRRCGVIFAVTIEPRIGTGDRTRSMVSWAGVDGALQPSEVVRAGFPVPGQYCGRLDGVEGRGLDRRTPWEQLGRLDEALGHDSVFHMKHTHRGADGTRLKQRVPHLWALLETSSRTSRRSKLLVPRSSWAQSAANGAA